MRKFLLDGSMGIIGILSFMFGIIIMILSFMKYDFLTGMVIAAIGMGVVVVGGVYIPLTYFKSQERKEG